MRTFVVLIVALLALWWASSVAYVVDETEMAIQTRFGRPTRTVLEAGLYFKWPAPVESVIRFDRRLQVFETPAPEAAGQNEEFLTKDKKNVLVGTYTAWRISPSAEHLTTFLQTVRESAAAEMRLRDLIVSELGAMLGANEFKAFVTTDAKDWKWPQLVQQIGRDCRARALERFGVEVVDFQIQRISFPEQNRRSVFDRMRAERERIASKFRAEGDREAQRITADAMLEAERIQSAAEESYLKTVGEATAEATRISNEAAARDPEFYELTRALEAYTQAFGEGTVLLLPPDTPFLRYLTQGATASAPAKAVAE